VVQHVFQGGSKGFPLRAPPVLQKGDFVLCGTNVSQQEGGEGPCGVNWCHHYCYCCYIMSVRHLLLLMTWHDPLQTPIASFV
jgi:hypothetical protein